MIFVDTGVFVSAADRDEPRHRDCATLLRGNSELAVAEPVIAEAAWMIESRLGPSAEARFLRAVIHAPFTIMGLDRDDYLRAINLIEAYHDLGLGFVDASIIALAERSLATEIATLNRRDFAVVRPRHADAFQLLP